MNLLRRVGMLKEPTATVVPAAAREWQAKTVAQLVDQAERADWAAVALEETQK